MVVSFANTTDLRLSFSQPPRPRIMGKGKIPVPQSFGALGVKAVMAASLRDVECLGTHGLNFSLNGNYILSETSISF